MEFDSAVLMAVSSEKLPAHRPRLHDDSGWQLAFPAGPMKQVGLVSQSAMSVDSLGDARGEKTTGEEDDRVDESSHPPGIQQHT